MSHALAITAGSLAWTGSGHTAVAAGDLPYWSAAGTPAILTIPGSTVRDYRLLQADSGAPAWGLDRGVPIFTETRWSARGAAATLDATSSVETLTAEAGGSATAGNDGNGMYSRRTSGGVGASRAGAYYAGADGRFDGLQEQWIWITTGSDISGNLCYFLGYEDNASAGMPVTGALTNDHIGVRYLQGTDAGWVITSADGAAQSVTALTAIAASTHYGFRITPVAAGGWRVRAYTSRGLPNTLTQLADVSKNTNNPTAATVGRVREAISTNGNARSFDAYIMERTRR
jgi:hypothetical protein